MEEEAEAATLLGLTSDQHVLVCLTMRWSLQGEWSRSCFDGWVPVQVLSTLTHLTSLASLLLLILLSPLWPAVLLLEYRNPVCIQDLCTICPLILGGVSPRCLWPLPPFFT